MEIRKTNLGVEYELELSEFGNMECKVLATLPNNKEWKEFQINGVMLVDDEDTSVIPDNQLLEAQQYINEQAIMYVSMELAKLMGEGIINSYTFDLCNGIGIVAIDKRGVYHHTKGLTQIEELIKQIRYSK